LVGGRLGGDRELLRDAARNGTDGPGERAHDSVEGDSATDRADGESARDGTNGKGTRDGADGHSARDSANGNGARYVAERRTSRGLADGGQDGAACLVDERLDVRGIHDVLR
jgi:hypothetical protein